MLDLLLRLFILGLVRQSLQRASLQDQRLVGGLEASLLADNTGHFIADALREFVTMRQDIWNITTVYLDLRVRVLS